ncbi:hypothetical protein G878_04176 [Escherichia coli KOEGE 3 (4a)]|nr:hypothetical protein G878_04176 [Escherichia coli KOEGE 3 (4a)]
MRDLLQRPDLFSINTATLGYKTPLPAIIDACAARGIGAIAPWRRECKVKISSKSPTSLPPVT